MEAHRGATRDIYLGTCLDYDCGIVEVKLDSGSPVQLDCYEPAAKARQVRRNSAIGITRAVGTYSLVFNRSEEAASSEKSVRSSRQYEFPAFRDLNFVPELEQAGLLAPLQRMVQRLARQQRGGGFAGD